MTAGMFGLIVVGMILVLAYLEEKWKAEKIRRHAAASPDASLDAAVIRPVKSASLRSLFLIDSLFFANAPDGAAKTDANVERHRMSC